MARSHDVSSVYMDAIRLTWNGQESYDWTWLGVGGNVRMQMCIPCGRPAFAQGEFLASLKRDSGYESKCIVSDYSG